MLGIKNDNSSLTVGTFYRAMSLDEIRKYQASNNSIPENKPWAGYYDYKSMFGRRVINHITSWVTEGIRRQRTYDVVVSLYAPLSEFQLSGVPEVYKNKTPISLDRIVVEEIGRTVSDDDLRGLKLSEKVARLLEEKGIGQNEKKR